MVYHHLTGGIEKLKRKDVKVLTEKKVYASPKLTIYGDVEKITLGASMPNSDDGVGTNNAYPNPSG